MFDSSHQHQGFSEFCSELKSLTIAMTTTAWVVAENFFATKQEKILEKQSITSLMMCYAIFINTFRALCADIVQLLYIFLPFTNKIRTKSAYEEFHATIELIVNTVNNLNTSTHNPLHKHNQFICIYL